MAANLFSTILDSSAIQTADMAVRVYAADRSRQIPGKPDCILFPSTTQQISDILGICLTHDQSVVPSGGRTGLAGAATASDGSVVLSLDRMNRIVEVDPVSMTITCEAGVILADAQDACTHAGMEFPIDYAAAGSAQIGGMIATNAGGIHVIQHGMTRHHILGLEVVLADGTVLDLNRKLVKDNSGYDLKQLFIGSEGTLGVITKATIQCRPMTADRTTILFAHPSIDTLSELLTRLRNDHGFHLHSFEMIADACIDAVIDHMPDSHHPFPDASPFYSLVDFIEPDPDTLEIAIEPLITSGIISDALLATNDAEIREFWVLREMISESLSMKPNLYKNDVSVPVRDIGRFCERLTQLIDTEFNQSDMYLFGHVGDGNVHVNVVPSPKNETRDEWHHRFSTALYAMVQQFDGSISAEHGIGTLKKTDLHWRRSEMELQLMRGIKTILDPTNIMNPGKVID